MNPSLDVSAEVSSLAPERKLRSAKVRHEPGGGGINVARGLHRLGADVCALFPAGGGIGRMLGALLEEEDVPFERIPIPRITRQSFAVHVEEADELYHFVLPGPELDKDDVERCMASIAGRDPAPRYLVASGSLPPGVPDAFYGRLTRAAREGGITVLLDTHGPPLEHAVDEGVFLIKPNLHEFRGLVGRSGDGGDENALKSQCRDFVASHDIEVLVVTLGADGALLTSRDRQQLLRPPPVSMVSPVGAGDSFMAALVAKLAAGASLDEAFTWGVAGAAAAVQTPATELFEAAEVQRLYQQIRNDDSEDQ